MVATERDPTKLRAGLRAAQGKVANSPQYNYSLARYAIMAGDYDLAMRVRPAAADAGLVASAAAGRSVLDIPNPSRQAPEIPFPENFYAYRFDVIPQELINELRAKATVAAAALTSQSDIARASGGGEPSTGGDQLGQPINSLRPIGDPGTDDPPGIPEVPPPTTPGQSAKGLADSARAFLDALEAWQLGNADFARGHYASAVKQYNACQLAALNYFTFVPDYQFRFTADTLAGRMDELVGRIAADTNFWSDLWGIISFRRQLLTLAELGRHDWTGWTPITRVHDIFQLLQGNLAGRPSPLPPTAPLPADFRMRFMDVRLLTIAAVLVPLARAEANRLRRQYAAAVDDLTRFLRRDIPVPNANPPKTVPAVLACEFIEYPFARLLVAETLVDQAEAQYKARLTVDDEPDAAKKAAAIARLNALADDFTTRNIPGAPDASTAPFQNLVAALTCASVLESHESDGNYVSLTKQALDRLHTAITIAVDAGDVTSLDFQSLGQSVTVPTIVPIGPTLPGLTSGTHPHEPYLQFKPAAGQLALRERNPRVYAVLLTAEARLFQIWSGFNYLGYRDDYVPPWRFQYLLERSRYFAEHARNAQRDYLNFLSNAENEELKELSAAQNVELEKANVQIETARVKQARKEVTAAKKSRELAKLNAKDAETRLQKFDEFDSCALGIDTLSALASTVEAFANPAKPLEKAGLVVGIAHGIGAAFGIAKGDQQRDLERLNLALAVGEANQAKKVADAQLAVARAGHVVAGVQRQAALLRHELALQSLQFMRNRALNTEQWYRLAGAIRSVGDTYLRYAIETSFLAQQAYNFEGDRRIDVVRFDYDFSDVGSMLAGDFLLRDLDTLEQDLIVSQKTRLQHVRYVLSLAREFPDLTRAIAKDGEGTFSMRLERLERHFPGLFNLRIDSVDVQPIALMDTTRTSIELTHLGTGMVRLKAQPGASPLNRSDLAPGTDWLRSAGAEWPVKVHVSDSETTFFGGLARQDVSPGTISFNERGTFEGLPAASSWRLGMSMSENQVVPGSLADVLVTFDLSGYHDPDLRAAIDSANTQTTALTTFLSAQETFPDAFYGFSRSGRMQWKVRRSLLGRNGDLGRLRNIGMSLRPAPADVHFSRLMARWRVSFRVNDTAGAPSGITVFNAMPEISVTQTAPLTVAVKAAMNGSTELAWDFGDGSPILRSVPSGTPPKIAPAEGTHTYAKPGRYILKLRCVQNDSLAEFRVAVAVSRNLKLGDPLIISPRLAFDPVAKAITLGTGGAVALAGRLMWRVGDLVAEGNTASFKLKPGNYVVEFAAVRRLNCRVYSSQRFFNSAAVLLLRGLSIATNRTFDLNGIETNGTGTPPLPPRNVLAKRLFDNGAISPEDDWTFELIPEEILGVPAGTAIAAEELDLSDLQDVALSMEYDVTPVVASNALAGSQRVLAT
jgi:hypothetical protein